MKLVDESTRAALSRNLEALMALRGMKQLALAKASGVTQSAISVILRRESGASIDTLAALGRALGVPAWALLMPMDAAQSLPSLPDLIALWSRCDTDGREYVRVTAAREASRTNPSRKTVE